MDENNNKKIDNKKKIIIIALVAVVLVIAIVIINVLFKKEEVATLDVATKAVAPTNTPTPTNTSTPTPSPTNTPKPRILDELGIEIPDLELDFDELHEENPDIFAWLYIPNTNVNYPLLMSDEDTDTDFYLDHEVNKEYGKHGSIYAQKINKKNMSDHNTVFYGHNMADTSMFGTLHYFEKSDFFFDEANRYAYIYTEDGMEYAYEIFAGYQFSDVLILAEYDCDSMSGFMKYIDVIYSNKSQWANFREDIKLTPGDRIITLSTCCGDPKQRYLIQARLINYDDMSKHLFGNNEGDEAEPSPTEIAEKTDDN